MIDFINYYFSHFEQIIFLACFFGLFIIGFEIYSQHRAKRIDFENQLLHEEYLRSVNERFLREWRNRK